MVEGARCPKCGWQNKAGSATCVNCFAPLNAPTTSAPPLQDERIQPGVGQAPNRPPAETGVSLGWVVVALVLLVGVGVGVALVVRSQQTKPPPTPTVAADVVADKFLQAKGSGDVAKVRPYLSAASIKKLETAFGSRQARSAGFDKAEVARMFLFDAAPPKNEVLHSKITIAKPAVDTETNQAIVGVKLVHERSTMFPGDESTCELVLVNADGNWKVDIELTAEQNGEGELEHFVPER